MGIVKRNSMIAGFVAACLLWLIWSIATEAHFQGGRTENSPSGIYNVSIMAPMEETPGGTYEIDLTNKATGQTVRSVSIELASHEKTMSLRGGPIAFEWNEEKSFVDIILDGELLTRIAIPATER